MDSDAGAAKMETADPAAEETPAPEMPVDATLATSHEVHLSWEARGRGDDGGRR